MIRERSNTSDMSNNSSKRNDNIGYSKTSSRSFRTKGNTIEVMACMKKNNEGTGNENVRSYLQPTLSEIKEA